MPDNITPEDFSELVSRIGRLTTSIDQLARAKPRSSGPTADDRRAKQQEQERQRRARDWDREQTKMQNNARDRDIKMGRRVEGVSRMFAAMEGDGNKLVSGFQRMTDGSKRYGATLSALTGALVGFGTNLTKSYREVADAGQLFTGNMMEMAQSAASAGLPLDEFAALVKKNTKLMAVFGTKGVTDMAKQVREMTVKQGNFGFTVEGLNEVTMSYLEIQRSFNVNVNRNNRYHTQNIANLAKTTTSLAAAFGSSRDEILKNTAEAMKEFNGLYMVTLGQSSDEVARKAAKATEVLEVIANIPVVGQDMVKALDTSVRMGTATMDENWRMIASKFPEITVGVDNLAARLRNGTGSMSDSIDLMVQTRDVLKKNHENIQYDTSEAGKKAADLLRELDNILGDDNGASFRKRKEQAEEAAKAMGGFTSGLLSLQSQLKVFGGVFLGGIYSGLMDVVKGFDDPAWQSAVESFKGSMKTAGESLGHLIGTIFTPANIKTLGNTISAFMSILSAAVKIGGSVLNAWSTIMGGLQTGAGWIGSFVDKIGHFTGLLDKNSTLFESGAKTLVTAAGVIGTALLLNHVKNKAMAAMGFRMKDMTINAGNVVVNSLMGGGGFGGLGGGGPNRRGKGLKGATRAARAAHAAEAAGKGGLLGLKGLKAGAGFGGKALSKFIPGLGLVAGGASALMRLKSGDGLGAGIDAISGLASLIPGIGTAVSLGLDGVNLARDMGGGAAMANVAGRGRGMMGGRAGLIAGGLGVGALGLGAGMLLSGGGNKENTVQIEAQEVKISAPVLGQTLRTPRTPVAPKSPGADLVDETRRQTQTLEKKLGESSSTKPTPDLYGPQIVELLSTMKNIEEASLIMQKDALAIAKKADAKASMNTQNKGFWQR